MDNKCHLALYWACDYLSMPILIYVSKMGTDMFLSEKIKHCCVTEWLPCHYRYMQCLKWWRHQMEPFPALLAICAGKGQWRGALMFFFICTRINDWVNNDEAGDWRRHRAHYDVTVMNDVYCLDVTMLLIQNLNRVLIIMTMKCRSKIFSWHSR